MATALDADSVGPVDVAVILFEGNKPGGPRASRPRSGPPTVGPADPIAA